MAVALGESSGDRLWRALAGRIRDRAVLAAIRRTPRDAFLDGAMTSHADDEAPLPIGFGQTTSSPYVIARMLEMLLNGGAPPAKVLEIGSGCGYQTAILCELGCAVVGVERIGALAAAAARRLRRLGYNNARVMRGDGWQGQEKDAPFDGVILCAEAAQIPPTLLAQLRPAGRLVAPLRRQDAVHLVAMDRAGEVLSRRDQVAFVPMREGTE